MHRQSCFWLVLTCFLMVGAIAGAEAPEVLYETYLPGYALPSADAVLVDNAGNAYAIAWAYGNDENSDILIVKLNPYGTELWSVYIEGSENDIAKGLALDSAGDLWVTGWTDSPDFPTVDPMDGDLTGFQDIFLMKLDADDGSILYSTFIGGDYVDSGRAIAINEADEIYLTGVAGSTDFPTTPDAYQPEPSFPLYIYQDAFIMKLAPSGDEILYSSYFGGTQDDWGDKIALDADDNIVIAGKTNADDFPLVNAYDENPDNFYVSKLSADGSTLLFSTYFGGSDYDRLFDMRLDAGGNAFLTGSTRSQDFPTTAGAYQENFVGAILGCEEPFGVHYNCEDFYASKLATDGSGLIWSTFIGGSLVDEARSIAFDETGNTYVVGSTNSDDFPPDGIDYGAEIAVCKLSDEGSVLDYTHLIDSSSAGRGNGVFVDAEGDIYFTGTVGVPASIYVSKLAGEHNTAADEDAAVASAGFILGPNYPNPFNPTTTISYTIPESARDSHVTLSIFDLAGRKIKELQGGIEDAGHHTVTWRGLDDRGSEASSGVYFYMLRWDAGRLSQRMVLIR